MIDLSIIIVSYNTEELTLKCIKSIYASLQYDPDIKAEIIIVDNASTDQTVNSIQNFELRMKNQKKTRNKPQMTYLLNDKNLGFGKANNQGVKKAQGKYVLFLNSDTEAIGDAIPRLYNRFVEKTCHYDFLGAKLLNTDHSPQPSCGPEYTLLIVFIWLILKGDYWGASRSSPNHECRVAWVSGACFITKKETYEAINGFDEGIFMYMEEIDLFMRSKKKGFTVGFYPDSHFFHVGSASSKGKSQPIIQVYIGLIYLYKKHYSYFEYQILKRVLKLKTSISLLVGKLLHNVYLVKTYEKALQIIEES